MSLVRTNNSDSMLGGVAGGLAKHFGIDPIVSRLMWVVFLLISGGTAAVVYIIMLLVVKGEDEVEL